MTPEREDKLFELAEKTHTEVKVIVATLKERCPTQGARIDKVEKTVSRAHDRITENARDHDDKLAEVRTKQARTAGILVMITAAVAAVAGWLGRKLIGG